jgi:pyruvate/2-oxoglutarate dehydrogenase complex dihydrolipoamide dehydrogenase (E3) component
LAVPDEESPYGSAARAFAGGIEIRLNSPVEGIEKTEEGVKVWAKSNGIGHPHEATGAVHGAGRVPDIDDLHLGAGGIEREGHRIRLNQSLQSISNPAVYAAADAAATGPMRTPVSELDADVVGEILLNNAPQRRPDYNGVPALYSPFRRWPRLASPKIRREPNICIFGSPERTSADGISRGA